MRLAPIAVLAAVLAVPASAAEDLKIGALLSVTGPAAFWVPRRPARSSCWPSR